MLHPSQAHTIRHKPDGVLVPFACSSVVQFNFARFPGTPYTLEREICKFPINTLATVLAAVLVPVLWCVRYTVLCCIAYICTTLSAPNLCAQNARFGDKRMRLFIFAHARAHIHAGCLWAHTRPKSIMLQTRFLINMCASSSYIAASGRALCANYRIRIAILDDRKIISHMFTHLILTEWL